MLMMFGRQEQDGCMMITTKQDEMRWVKQKPFHYNEQSDYSAFWDDESDYNTKRTYEIILKFI